MSFSLGLPVVRKLMCSLKQVMKQWLSLQRWKLTTARFILRSWTMQSLPSYEVWSTWLWIIYTNRRPTNKNGTRKRYQQRIHLSDRASMMMTSINIIHRCSWHCLHYNFIIQKLHFQEILNYIYMLALAKRVILEAVKLVNIVLINPATNVFSEHSQSFTYMYILKTEHNSANELANTCNSYTIPIRALPQMYEVISGKPEGVARRSTGYYWVHLW